MGLPVAVKGDLAAVGGGIPMVAAWTETMGMAVGLAEPYPVAVSLPVRVPPDERVELSAEFEPDVRLQHEQTFTTPRTFVSVYEGDYADALANYAGILARQGLPPAKPADSDYGAFWSSLGYGRDVTPAQMTGTIPKLKELGIGWAALDDRWARTYGDWEPRGDTFPGDSLRKVVQEFHRNAIKVLLAWFPLGVEDGEGREASRKYEVAQVVRDHPDWLILDKSGKHAHGTRGLAVLCPALPEVQEYYRALTTRFLRDWDFDGNRLEDVYSVPRCYNPRHHHKSPDDSIRAMGEVFKAIHSTARAIRPDSVTQIDPDGTLPNMAWLAYLDQGAAGDPANLQQARRRLQTYKALLGPRAAVSSGFAELLENAGGGSETAAASAYFASTLGTGGVLSTAFTWPESASRSGKFFLSPEKEVLWKKWFGLYAQRKLSSGGFLDLYRYGFDSPEGYVLRQDGKLYYAFFAPEPDKPWKGNIELRGLARRVQYRVFDYENQKELGTVESPVFTMPVEFTGHLLLEVSAKQ
jgi:alpha-galactosidase